MNSHMVLKCNSVLQILRKIAESSDELSSLSSDSSSAGPPLPAWPGCPSCPYPGPGDNSRGCPHRPPPAPRTAGTVPGAHLCRELRAAPGSREALNTWDSVSLALLFAEAKPNGESKSHIDT